MATTNGIVSDTVTLLFLAYAVRFCGFDRHISVDTRTPRTRCAHHGWDLPDSAVTPEADYSKPFIWLGLAGLSILVILAATSNNFSIRKLGGKNWKRLHRLAYTAAALLIYHQAIAGKGHWYIARWLLLSLLALQTARVTKHLVMRRARTSRMMCDGQSIRDRA